MTYLMEIGSRGTEEDPETLMREKSKVDFILASGSPRRRELLDIVGWKVSIHPVTIEEIPLLDEDPKDFVRRLALEKAERVVNEDGLIVVGADTIVIHVNRILGKPHDEKSAAEMLKELKGIIHRVITAIAIVDPIKGQSLVETCETAVPMRNYSQTEIEAYIATGSPMDKAGAYGIQDASFYLVDLDSMTGCFANVMGLPLCHLARGIRKMGIEPPEQIVERCMKHTNYPCQVHGEILW